MTFISFTLCKYFIHFIQSFHFLWKGYECLSLNNKINFHLSWWFYTKKRIFGIFWSVTFIQHVQPIFFSFFLSNLLSRFVDFRCLSIFHSYLEAIVVCNVQMTHKYRIFSESVTFPRKRRFVYMLRVTSTLKQNKPPEQITFSFW